MRRIDGRLKVIEKSVSGDVNLRGIIGRYYDELTEEEQKAWFRYRYDGGHDIRVMEQMETYFNGSLHFVCDKKPKPPTDEEIKERAEEIEQFFQARREEYNKGGKDGLFYNSV